MKNNLGYLQDEVKKTSHIIDAYNRATKTCDDDGGGLKINLPSHPAPSSGSSSSDTNDTTTTSTNTTTGNVSGAAPTNPNSSITVTKAQFERAASSIAYQLMNVDETFIGEKFYNLLSKSYGNGTTIATSNDTSNDTSSPPSSPPSAPGGGTGGGLGGSVGDGGKTSSSNDQST